MYISPRDRERAEEIAKLMEDQWDSDLVDELAELAQIPEEELAAMRESECPVEVIAEAAARILEIEI